MVGELCLAPLFCDLNWRIIVNHHNILKYHSYQIQSISMKIYGASCYPHEWIYNCEVWKWVMLYQDHSRHLRGHFIHVSIAWTNVIIYYCLITEFWSCHFNLCQTNKQSPIIPPFTRGRVHRSQPVAQGLPAKEVGVFVPRLLQTLRSSSYLEEAKINLSSSSGCN